MDEKQLKLLIIRVLEQRKLGLTHELKNQIDTILQIIAKKIDEVESDKDLIILGKYQVILQEIIQSKYDGREN